MTRISPCNFFKNRRGTLALIIILSVLLIDQIIKFWIKTSYYIGQDEEITPWFHLHFIENNGMAFGWEIGSKLLLTTIRIIVTALVCVYIWRIRNRSDLRTGYIVCLALIVAGAAGNIIDCAFYGLIFNDPAPIATATLFPEGGGYGSFLQGRVVDMFYFPIASWDWPSWLPIIGSRHFIFFQPVFNFADAAISVGIIAMLLFYRKDFASSDSPKFVDSKSQAIDGDTKS